MIFLISFFTYSYGVYKEKSARKDYRKIFTDIDLPLDETDMKKLLSIMDKEIGSIAREVKKQHVSEKC